MDMSVTDTKIEVSEIKPKKHYKGKVLKTVLSGAAIDIGLEKPGRIHISQIINADGEAVRSVEDTLQVGQEVDVWIKKIRDGNIELTMIKPLEFEWRDLKPEMVVKGVVVRLEKFGAFVEIGAERPGLIHISEMAHGFVRAPEDVLKVGDDVEAMVLDVIRKKKQIKLSLKAMQPEIVEEPPQPEPEPEMLPKKQPRNMRRRKKGKKDDEEYENEREYMAEQKEEASAEVDPTAMEIAIRNAMEKAKSKGIFLDTRKKGKSSNREQEDLLSRTLEQKVRTA